MSLCLRCRTALPLRTVIGVAAGLIFLGMVGCHSSSSSTKAREEQVSTAAAKNPAPLLNLNCIFDWIGKPTESFHYSYARHNETDFRDPGSRCHAANPRRHLQHREWWPSHARDPGARREL